MATLSSGGRITVELVEEEIKRLAYSWVDDGIGSASRDLRGLLTEEQIAAIDRCKPNLELVESLLADGGYTGQPFADGVMERLDATVQIVKRNELHTFAVLPKRWIVERSFAWLEKCRRLWKNCERKLNTSLQMIHLAFLRLLLRRS